MITIKDIQGILSAFILYQKQDLIAAMNASGYRIASNISDNDLYNEALSVFSQRAG